ncbi:hypothetical protein HMP0721_2305 [Pseudoramibacter alactolyticus ATCC 23263]|uniref:Uncharacterized protein n=1 Tax=Pseudoramibacter alactolyticus ATCC 23263 TaxID=887929 RepID=E6MJX0_9FIRM|nr:hypothetical protein HMP0721_2305 [Pseudoramibacter alactolyticus ATCC 23263]
MLRDCIRDEIKALPQHKTNPLSGLTIGKRPEKAALKLASVKNYLASATALAACTM